jgi:predicted RNase H-like HicB family nuclease
MRKKYLVVIEKTKTGYSAYSPDLPGCIATGKTKKQVEKSMKDAIEFHLEGLRDEGRRPPMPQSYSAYMKIAV